MNLTEPADADGLRVLVMCADAGPAHATLAPDIAAQLRERSEVSAVQLTTELSVLGSRFGRFLTTNLRPDRRGATPTSTVLFQALFESKLPPLVGQFALAGFGHRRLVEIATAFAADVVVTEHPMLSAALGQMKMLGRFPLPLISVVTDPAELRNWAHPGVDMHLLVWPQALAEVDSIAGPGKAVAVRPLLDPGIEDMPAHGAARASAARVLKLSLKGGRTLVLISGGEHADGDLVGAVEAIVAEMPAAAVAVSTGRNEGVEAELSARLAGFDQVRVIGSTDKLGTLMAAADVLVDTTDGSMALAARLAGCPLIIYGRGSAHAEDEAAAFAKFGVGSWARSRADLGRGLSYSLEAGRPERLDISALPQAVDVVIATALGQ